MISRVEVDPDARLAREAAKARLLLEAARYLGETLDLVRVYARFREILADEVPHDGVVVSAFDEREGVIRCEYAWVDGELLDPAIFPPLIFKESGGMQSQVIRSGEPLLTNEVRERVKDAGTYYDVDSEGAMRKVPDEGAPLAQAAMMVPVRHEGRVVGVVQVMSDHQQYTEEQLALVEGLVGQLAAAVRVAHLHEERARLEAAESAARATAAEREHAARVLEAVGDGIYLLDRNGVVRLWNHAAELLTGLPAERIVGRKLVDEVPVLQSVADRVPVAGAGVAARSVTLPVDLNGRELWLSFVGVRSSEGIVYAVRDLTLERQLDEAKSDFIATVSHELRTPMTAVLGAAKTLLRTDVSLSPEQRRQLLEMIETQATRLSQVTEEVLLASSLDRGELPLSSDPVDVGEVLRETIEAMEAQLPPGVTLRLRDGHAGLAAADRDRVQQVLVNLINNAGKYSPSGGEVLISSRRGPGGVRVDVRDHGIGIAPAEQPRIFEKFYRSDPQLARGAGGTGLGLYICRELVQRMGGQIGVRSVPGAGSRFYFDLPPA